MKTTSILVAAALAAALLPPAAPAQTPNPVGQALEAQAKVLPGFAGFSAQRGQALFAKVGNGDWSCTSCHTANPINPGKHAQTGKEIAPLAPAANPARLTDTAKAEKWFKRNCNDVLGRECTVQEKGDVAVWLLALKR
ncbi:MAG: DUF1924 domain-containing protein [Betaproteobacteria bacterium]